MKAFVRKIDRAIKKLYALDLTHPAENYLIEKPLPILAVGSGKSAPSGMSGAVYVQSDSVDEMDLGIYLSAGVREELKGFGKWKSEDWSHDRIAAFCVAVEEISHFNYLVHQGSQGRRVSQLELELQGEVDKFLLTFFAMGSKQGFNETLFWALFEKFFHSFRLSESLSDLEKERYASAIRFARRYIKKCEGILEGGAKRELTLRDIRSFYRLSHSEKLSYILA